MDSAMTQAKSMDALTKVVETLSPLSSEERARVVRAAMAMLGDASPTGETNVEGQVGSIEGLSPRARIWMKQNSVTSDQLQQVFHLSGNGAEVIAPQLPG